MRPKSIALLLLALGCGLVASIGITEVVRRNSAHEGVAGETQPIFVAMADIGLGDQITSQMLKLEQWPKDKVPQGSLSKVEDVEGRRARTKIYAGEPLLENRLLGKGASAQGATALIPKGYRVVPVKVDLVSGGSALILPGDRVDVMVHLIRDPGRDIQETVTRTILQDIKVFAVDDVVDLEKEKENSKPIPAKTISLLVTPEQAAKLTLATHMGVINLVMRSPEDEEQVVNTQAKPSELFSTTLKKNRPGETLMDPAEANPTPASNTAEKPKSFLDFLNAVKTKEKEAASGTATAAGEEFKPRKVWTMRMLKPDGVEEIQLEAADDGPDSWKSTTVAVKQGGEKSPKNAPKAAAPSKAPPAKKPAKPPAKAPVAPAAEEPPPMKAEPDNDGAYKSDMGGE
jgi:pilus assembly protein CpaB